MRHDDKLVIIRTTTVKDQVTHLATPSTLTLPNIGFYQCRLGSVRGNLVQGQPQGTYIQQSRIYIPDVNADIKKGDIGILNSTVKYIIGNVYKPNNHHIEADVTYKEEV